MSERISTPQDWQAGLALLAIRVAGGIAFIYHGAAHLFGSFGGPGPIGFAHMLHVPVYIATLVGFAEFLGGISLLTGILARLGALAIMPVMLGAIVMVHWHNGLDVTKGGFEYAFTQLLIAVAILIAGAGPYSLLSLLLIQPRPRARANRRRRVHT